MQYFSFVTTKRFFSFYWKSLLLYIQVLLPTEWHVRCLQI